MTTMSRRTLGRAATLEFLEGLKATAGEARTIYLPPGMSLEEIESIAGEAIPAELPKLAAASPTGAAIFQFPDSTTLVLPHSQFR